MGQILVRNLEDTIIERLKARALKADKSLEQTVRDILSRGHEAKPRGNPGRYGPPPRADRAGNSGRHRSHSRRPR